MTIDIVNFQCAVNEWVLERDVSRNRNMIRCIWIHPCRKDISATSGKQYDPKFDKTAIFSNNGLSVGVYVGVTALLADVVMTANR